MDKLEDSALKALIELLDDPDEEIFAQIRSKFISLGNEVIPSLESAWENTFNNRLQTRIEEIIQSIQFKSVQDDLSHWANAGGLDLLEGTLLISRYQYPDLNEEQVRRKIEMLKKDIWLELSSNLTAFEKVQVMNHILYSVHQFTGNKVNYHAPQNSYLNNVLESKKGNPLMLSILYSILAQGLHIPIYGVNLPEHFVLAYVDEYGGKGKKDSEQDILFYINPFSRGVVFSKEEIDVFLSKLNLEPKKEYYQTCSNIEIIKRQLRNLIFSYEKLGYPNKVDDLKKLLQNLEYHE